MTVRKTVHLLTAAAVLAATLPAAAEARRKPPATPKLPHIGVPYTVKFTASRTITWKIPKHYTYSDCGHKWWHAGSGSETWEVTSRGAGRVDINARDGEVQFLYPGTSGGVPRFWIDAGAVRTRAGRIEGGYDPGPTCAVDTPQPVPAKTDCGTRLPDNRIVLFYGRGRLYWTLGAALDEQRQGKVGFE